MFFILLREELQGLPRGRFSLLATSVLLSAVCVVGATAGTMEDWQLGFLFPAFGVVPLLLLPWAAMHVAHARDKRFFHAVLASSSSAGEYLLARQAVVLLVGLAYIAALLPFVAVYAWHLGAGGAIPYVLLGLGSVVFSTVVGTLVGVLFTGKGYLAPLAASGIALLVALGGTLFTPSAARIADPSTQETMTRLLHLTGTSLLGDAFGTDPSMSAASPGLALLAFALICAGAFVASWIVFTRAQSAERWEWSPRRRLGGVILLAGVLLSPAVLADTDYHSSPSGRGSNLSSQGLFGHVVPRGAPPPPSVLGDWIDGVVSAGEANEVDLILLFHAGEASGPFVNFTIRLKDAKGEGLRVEPSTVFVENPEIFFMGLREGSNTPLPAFRLPVVLETGPVAGMRNTHRLHVEITYESLSTEDTFEGHTMLVLESRIHDAPLHMVAAGTPFPLLALIGHVVRRWRTR